MIIVIADDITGAAEMAGLAFEHGLETTMVLDFEQGVPGTDVVVVATDTRQMTGQQAADTTARLMRQCREACHRHQQNGQHPPTVVFKKTDSALRGHVMAELRAALSSSPYKKALFLPANPSRGRVVKDGVYYCGGIPISQTDFAFDPEFPALTDSMALRFPEAVEWGITMPDAVTTDEVRAAVEACTDDTLLAGAADLFEALLLSRGHQPEARRGLMTLGAGAAIVVGGSTQCRRFPAQLPTVMMPLGVYDGTADARAWIEEAMPVYRHHRRVALYIPFRHLTGKPVAMRLRQTTAIVVQALIEARLPSTLVVEGGATAYSCLDALGWRQFTIAEVYAPGVVRMTTPQGVNVVLKPGSYPWPQGGRKG